jgi:hypothetical protein
MVFCEKDVVVIIPVTLSVSKRAFEALSVGKIEIGEKSHPPDLKVYHTPKLGPALLEELEKLDNKQKEVQSIF